MKVRIKNNSPAPYGIEKVGGGYAFVDAGAERTVDAANPAGLYARSFLEVEGADSQVKPIPASLKAKAKAMAPILDVKEVLSAEVAEPAPTPSPLDHDGKDGAGGSVKGFHSTAAKGARRRRSKAASK